MTPTTCSPFVLDAEVQPQLPNVFVLANKPPEHQLWHGNTCARTWLTANVPISVVFGPEPLHSQQQLVHSWFRLTLSAH